MTTTYFETLHSKRRNRADWLLSLVWISTAVVIALFFADGGSTSYSSAADIWTAIGQLTGLVATNLLLVQLVLISRLPLIDRTFGHDKATLLHRQLGKPILYLLLVHATTLTVGYGLSNGSKITSWISSMLALPDIWLAVFGILGLIAVVGTSITLVRKKLDYDLWFIVHLLAYVAVALSIPHQFSEGGYFTDTTVAKWYWIALYVIAGGSIFVYRLLIPLIASLRHSLYVSEVKQESATVVTVTLKGRDIHKLNAQGGQFFMWRFWEKGLWWQGHPFSLSASPQTGTLRITVRALGNGSEKIQRIRPGTRVSFAGPYGIFSERSRTKPNLLLMGAGIGVAPIRALLEDTSKGHGSITIILRQSANTEVYLLDELEQLAEAKGARLFVLQGSKSSTFSSWLPEQYASNPELNLSWFAPHLTETDLYICGANNWTQLVVDEAKQLGMTNHQIHWERFNW